MGVKDLMRGSKDAVLAAAARRLFNTNFPRIGEITDLSVNTATQEIRLRVELVGESEHLEIHVRKYQLDRDGDTATLTVLDATASRPWLAEALREFVIGRTFAIPPKASAMLTLLG